MTDLRIKLTKTIPSLRTNATTVALVFPGHLVANYDVPSMLPTDNGPQLALKFFTALHNSVGVNNFTTAEYKQQTNGQAEPFNCTLISQLRRYKPDHQKKWDAYLLP